MYLSRWSSAQKASEFAFIYAKGLKDRYTHVREAGAETKTAKPANYTIETLTGTHSYLTEEGPVVIEIKGDMVLVSESLDQDTTDKIDRDVFPSAASR
jgi:hypothetical protein